LRRDSHSVLADHTGVNSFCHGHAFHVTEPLLAHLLGCSETAHQSGVAMAKNVKAIAARQNDAE
jgi:hypothetical protein